MFLRKTKERREPVPVTMTGVRAIVPVTKSFGFGICDSSARKLQVRSKMNFISSSNNSGSVYTAGWTRKTPSPGRSST